ncbi:O-antigen ligase family protein [Poritiphilus flavus]|uniref:O-antigen ligase-related domain-containing protein n=1 Tax=Poritiphilus flavus TaxID=2697053 RepID=A0A6L9E8E4_9FLAO|nr:O-antigen ligase family protein [Poritiphilus flavus]NAS10970.1 hypothetical protein [Poritiphilus flavus]
MQKLISRTKNVDLIRWSAAIFAMSFSFGIAVNSISFFLFVFAGIAISINDIVRKRDLPSLKQFNFPLIVFFAWIAIRETFVSPSEAFQVVFYYLAFLIVPLVIGFQAQRLKKELPIILKAFLLGCIINAMVNLGFGIYRGVILNESGINFWYFTYQFLAEPFGMQPIYLGFFYVFALLILVSFSELRKHKVLYYATFCLLSLSIVLLAARNAMVCLVLLVPLYLVIREKISFKKVLVVLGILGVCFALALQNPIIKNRILKVNKKGNFFSGSSLRAGIWNSAYNASQNDIFWGSGEKKGSILLLQEFETRKLEIPLKYKYHAHSQYLQTLLQYGILGFLLLLSTLLWPLVRSFVLRNYLGLFWILLVCLTSVTEAIFTRQWGVYGFAFFTCLLLLREDVSGSEQKPDKDT